MEFNADITNPFSDRGPIVKPPGVFFGRSHEMFMINRRVIQGSGHTNLAIISEKRIGASSLAYRVFFHDRAALHEKRIVPVWIDMSGFDSDLMFFSQIIRELFKETAAYGLPDHARTLFEAITKNSERSWGDLFGMVKEFLAILVNQKIRAICIIDDFDKGTRALFKQNIHFFQALRELGYHPGFRLSLVVISRRDIRIVEEQSGAISTLAGIFDDKVFLKPFNSDELKEYFQMFEKLAIPLEQAHIDRINYYCGGWPYLLNVICYEIVEDFIETDKINIDKVFEKSKNKFTDHYDSIIRDLRNEGRFENLLKIFLYDFSEVQESEIREFVNIGLLADSEDDKMYKACSEHFRQYLETFSDQKGKISGLINKFEGLFSSLHTWITGEQLSFSEWVSDDNISPSFIQSIATHLNRDETELERRFKELRSISETLEISEQDLSSTKMSDFSNYFNGLVIDAEKLEQQKDDILLQRLTSGPFESQTPIAIKRLTIRNYHNIDNIEIKDLEGVSWIFLTGENGYGKTVLLQASVIALTGGKAEWGGGRLAPEKFNVGMELIEKGKPKLYNLRNVSFFKPFDRFAAYGPSRLNVQHPTTMEDVSKRSSATYGIFNTDGILLNIERHLLDLDKVANEDSSLKHTSAKQLKLLKDALLKLLHPYVMEIDTKGTRVRYREKGSDKKRPLEQLASGIRSIIALVGDMFLRLSENMKVVETLEDISGIVIIDEFDLHLHPKMQKCLPGLLSKIFPNVCFFVSTHSPIPLLGAPSKSAFLKVRKTDDHRIQVEQIKIDDINKMQPNILLTSPIFDMEDIFHVEKKISEVHTEDHWQELERHKKTRKNLIDKFQQKLRIHEPDAFQK